MTMQRRQMGSGRRLAGLAAIVIVAASFLPWWHSAPEGGLPPISENAFAGAGVIVFFVGLAVIALLALPYAAGDVPVGVDRPLSFILLAVLGWVALVVRLVDIATTSVEALQPQRAPGLWLAALGLVILSRAAYDIAREPSRR